MMADKMTSINEALAAYGFGPESSAASGGGDKSVAAPKVHIIAEVRRLTIKTQIVYPIHPKTQIHAVHHREFFREQVDTQYYRDDLALIGIPAAFVKVFQLEDYVLTDEQEREYRRRVERRFL